jgi:LEA14-like dessication related protein
MKKYLCVLLPVIPLLCLACKTPPPPEPEEMPKTVLAFKSIRADNIKHVVLHFILSVENPYPRQMTFEIKNWNSMINTIPINHEIAKLDMDMTSARGAKTVLEPNSKIEKSLILEINLEDMPASFGAITGDEYITQLDLDVDYHYGSSRFENRVSVSAAFPRIMEPQFTITSIAIMQAELINTRFRVCLRIDNPNIFPVSLSSMGYELYGEGRFWADGREKEILVIPAQGSSETNLFLIMNFINMKRQLLDDIIAMRLVRYRFTGNVEVGTGVSWLPSFNMGFDRSGNSVVLK